MESLTHATCDTRQYQRIMRPWNHRCMRHVTCETLHMATTCMHGIIDAWDMSRAKRCTWLLRACMESTMHAAGCHMRKVHACIPALNQQCPGAFSCATRHVFETHRICDRRIDR